MNLALVAAVTTKFVLFLTSANGCSINAKPRRLEIPALSSGSVGFPILANRARRAMIGKVAGRVSRGWHI